MATKIRKHTASKKVVRFKRKRRIRGGGVLGSTERPRFSVFKSNKYIYAQLVDDVKGTTLVAASTVEADSRNAKLGSSLEAAKTVGKLLATRALEKKIDKVVFDRSGYLYHGKIKALADAAREAGLKF